jgi:hypothetical protein
MKKTRIIAILACVVSFSVGILTVNAAQKENEYTKTSEYENINICVYEDDYDETNYDLYLENLKTIPSGLIKNCDNIYFTNENLNKKFELDDIITKIVALSYGKDIYVNTEYFSEDVLIHEMYHVYDYSNNWISDSDEFVKLYEEYKDDFEVSPGNVENSYEFFATYGENFSLKDDLEETNLYTFFNNLNIQP